MGDCGNFTVELKDVRSIALGKPFTEVVPYDFGSGGKEDRLGKVRLQRMKNPEKNRIVSAAPSSVCIRVNVSINKAKFVLGAQRDLHAACPGGIIVTI